LRWVPTFRMNILPLVQGGNAITQRHQYKNRPDFRTEQLFSLSLRARYIDFHEDTGLGEDPRVFTYSHLLNSSHGGSLLLKTLRC
jgi:hypothetical protein